MYDHTLNIIEVEISRWGSATLSDTLDEHSLELSPSILVTGATGFIGSRLVSRLSADGLAIRGTSRKKIPDKENIKYVQVDVLEAEQLEQAMKGITIAYYLLHSMEGDKRAWQEFASRERAQAQNFLRAATQSGVKRIIYLGGLVNDGAALSPHMKSRKEVGKILASGSIPVTELRASLIIGAGGGSYAMLRYLVERLRIMVCPSWVRSIAQPIAVDDVIGYLVGCLYADDTVGKIFEIGGPDKMTYEELMRAYAAYLNRNLLVLHIPFLTTRLSSYWVDLITPVKASLARPLIDSLVHDTIVTDDSISKIIPMHLKSVRDSIDAATIEMSKSPPVIKLKEKTGFRVNQFTVQISLVLLGICGIIYLLGERFEAYHLFGGIMWYVAAIIAIAFIRNKTRLGYLISGVLSWVTLGFWLFDVFVANTLSSLMIPVLGFAGIITAALSITASHNLFYKVTAYQYKGKPL